MNEPVWGLSVPVTVQGVTRQIPLTNFAGRNYLTPFDPVMEKQVGIREGHRVLDIGGGDHPFARANVVTEPYLEDTAHRGGRRAQRDKRYVECFAEDMPFKNKEFDFAISRHVFEHTKDPGAACREMSRVAKRGFIEVPSAWHELFYGYPVHRWLITNEDGVLVFRPKPFMRSPFLNCLLWMVYHYLDFIFRWEYQYRNITSIQFPWEREVRYRVKTGPGLDYDDPNQVAEAQLAMVQDGLAFGGIPAAVLLNELKTSLDHKPNYASALNALGVIRADEKNYEEAQQAFREALRLEPGNVTHVHNTRILPAVEKPAVDLLPAEPWDLEDAPLDNFMGTRFDTVSDHRDHSLVLQLGITDSDRVLEVVWRDDPLQRAGEVLSIREYSPSKGLPYPDRAFDWVISRLVLQAVESPAVLCSELQRVARKGFIEVPRFFWEYVYGRPENRWLCDLEKGVLVFRRKRFSRIPFKSILLSLLRIHPALLNRFEYSLRNVAYVQMLWDGELRFRVEDDPECPFDYSRNEDALVAQTDYALNLCDQGATELALSETEALLARSPDDPMGLALMGIIQWRLGKKGEGLGLLARAAELAPDNAVIVDNYRMFSGQSGPSSTQEFGWLPEL